MQRTQIPPGTLEMLILRMLLTGPLHRYAIAKQIQTTSENVLRVEEGSLYPALQRLLRKDMVPAKWVTAGPKRRARVYRLTSVGQKQSRRPDRKLIYLVAAPATLGNPWRF